MRTSQSWPAGIWLSDGNVLGLTKEDPVSICHQTSLPIRRTGFPSVSGQRSKHQPKELNPKMIFVIEIPKPRSCRRIRTFGTSARAKNARQKKLFEVPFEQSRNFRTSSDTLGALFCAIRADCMICIF